ncbi:MAG: branched-chain amino acid aminotransferase [Planctomycetota bacterium]|jgi:branched-chain amino acid aminotransferase
MQKSEFVWQDGEYVAWADAKIHVLSHVIHYGTGVFEGLRAYATPKGPAILSLVPHARRLFHSAKIVGMRVGWTQAQIEEAILETVRRNGHDACYIRPLVFRGCEELGIMPEDDSTNTVILTVGWGALHGEAGLEKGVDVGVSSWRRMAPNTHPSMAKATGNYLNSHLIVTEAKQNGFDEGLVLDTEGYVSEGSGENLFLIMDGVIHTPPIGNSILAGITRANVMQLAADAGIEVREERIPREMLYIADEVFMTGTAAEITPIRSVDRKPVGSGWTRGDYELPGPGPISKRLQQDYFAILRGEAEDRHHWLTHVNS